MAFTAPIDILNRAFQIVGSPRRSLTDVQRNISEALFAYDKIRLAALRRNLWTFATRRVVLRPVGVDTVLWTPPTWAAGTYAVGAVAAFAPTSGPYSGETIYWQTSAAKTSGNTATPDDDADWHRYFGPVAIDLYGNGLTTTSTVIADGIGSYHAGEVVLVPAAYSGATTYSTNQVVAGSDNNWYVSLANSNLNHDPTTDAGVHWALWTSGRSTTGWGETTTGTMVPLTYPGTPRFYMSLVSSNTDNPLATGAQWLALNGTGAPLEVLYPINSGPSTQIQTLNAFRLPYGYLREAPDNPKANAYPYLGAPRGEFEHDWVREGDYIVSGTAGATAPIMVRFVANVIDVPDMDPMFCEGVACQIALDGLVMTLTDAPEKRQIAKDEFSRVMTEARIASAIEMGPVDTPVSRYITCRV